MKTIILTLVILFIWANFLEAQNKRITVYYNCDSTEVVNIANTDSIVIFICGVNQVSYEDKVYNTVAIGEQCWLRENLDVGTQIDGSINQQSGNGIEKYCYDNNSANCTTYGGLYQWNETMQYVTTEGSQGICPDGWHIPTSTEFETLKSTVSSDGNALKAIGQGSGSGAGTNTSGFTALLAGRRRPDTVFERLLGSGYFWSSTLEPPITGTMARLMVLWSFSSLITLNTWDNLGYGFSVRCIKD